MSKQPSRHNEKPDLIKRITLDEVAAELGLAKSTVSLALRGSPKVRPQTQQQVRETAKRMGYHADAVLSAYARRRRQGLPAYHATIGVLWPAKSMARLQPETETQAAALGYRTDHYYLNDYTSPGQLAKILHARGIPALLVIEHHLQGEMAGFPWDEFLAVQCGVARIELPIPMVRYNAFETMRIALDHLKALQCEKIVAALPHHGEAPSKQHDKTLAAYEFLLQRVTPGTRPTPPLVGTVDAVFRAFPAWLAKVKPDAVIGPWPRFYHEYPELLKPDRHRKGYLALRANPWEDGVAGLLIHQKQLEQAAISYLDSEFRRASAKGTEMPRIALVVEPEWKAGRSLRESANMQIS